MEENDKSHLEVALNIIFRRFLKRIQELFQQVEKNGILEEDLDKIAKLL